MTVTVSPGKISGAIPIPGSKSHTIRALLIAALADGDSTIRRPLRSADTAACIDALGELGVDITDDGDVIRVTGRGPHLARPAGTIDCANSGTTLYLMLSVAALQSFPVRFDGDDQLRRRSAGPLLAALESCGARVDRENGDCVPLTITGPIATPAGGTSAAGIGTAATPSDGSSAVGGSAPIGKPAATGKAAVAPRVSISCPTSQYLSSLLLAAPLSAAGIDIDVPLLHERPYVGLTLGWLDRQGIDYARDEWRRFTLPGGQRYTAYDAPVPGDFSSATFFIVAAAATGSDVELLGLDMTDSQGDKAVIAMVERLGARVTVGAESIRIHGPERLSGGTIDLNATPDALPALALLGTTCSETLRLVNVPQAREKETDRIAVMADVIARLGGSAEELPDGLVVHPRRLRGGTVDSAGDHRVAMAAAIAGLFAEAAVTVTRADVASITFPGFYDLLAAAGARLSTAASAGHGAPPSEEA